MTDSRNNVTDTDGYEDDGPAQPMSRQPRCDGFAARQKRDIFPTEKCNGDSMDRVKRSSWPDAPVLESE